MSSPSLFFIVVASGALLALANEAASLSCWEGAFNEELCCGSRWGLTGNPICWDAEYTYLQCCGLDAFPRRAQDDAAWEEFKSRQPQAAAEEEYDYVVIGAGSAGSVVAARLSAALGPDGRPWRVLLLEAGPEDAPEEDTAHPDLPPQAPQLWREPLNVTWGAGRDARLWSYSTGQGLGGTSAINSMIYMRGSVSEYEALGWTTREVLDAYAVLEAHMEVPGFAPNSSFHDVAPRLEESGYHLTLVSPTVEELPPLFRSLISAFEAAGVPFRVDPHSSESMHGLGGIWRSMGCGDARCQPSRVPRFRNAKGRPRSSPYRTLVAPAQRLEVSPHRTVERIVISDEGLATAVEVTTDTSERMAYRVTREVIIAAGVFGSPKLLTLSGIGEPAELDRLGIPLVINSPDVGRHLNEHVGLSIVVGTSVPCPEGFHKQGDGTTTHLGNLDEFIAQMYAFFNSTADDLGAPGPLDVEVMLLEGCLEDYLSLTFTVMLLQSGTRGRVVVQSRNPFTPVHLDYKPLSDSSDIDKIANAMRRLYTGVFSSPALSEFELTVTPPWEVVADIGQLARWIRLSLYYYSHPSGTCRIRRPEVSGVLDSQLRVQGTQNLRVADASVFPESPTAHTDGPSRLVGELAARFILGAAGGGDDGAPSGVPAIGLRGYQGAHLPLCGFGTNGFEGARARTSVELFLRAGGRMVDTALLYDNHRDVGAAILASGVPRTEVFVVSKIPPMEMGHEEAGVAIDRMVSELGTHVDLALIHWPANFDDGAKVPACAQAPGSWPSCRRATWRAMEEAHRDGKVRSLGVSNFGVRHLRDIIEDPNRKLPIAANEVEFHPWWPQRALRKFCAQHHIAMIAYGSTGGSLMGGAMLRVPNVVRAAKSAGRSPVQVLLRWAVQQGVAVIPSSSSEAHLLDNLDVSGWELSPEEFALVGAVGPQDHMRVYLPDPENAP